MDNELLGERFEGERARLQTVAYRLLGSASEADDAVQEAWLRLSRSDAAAVQNLGGWLTTVISRICLDMLRARQSRREEPLEPDDGVLPDPEDPEREVLMTEAVGAAMLTVLERLTPFERVSFVLHDVFGVSFDEVAEVLDRTPAAARQLASRGRRRVQGASEERSAPDVEKQRDVVGAFFRASRAGDFQALLAVLAPGVVLRPDAAALQMGQRNGWITSELRGPEAVATRLSGQAQGVLLALIDGLPGAAWMANGRPVVAFVFTLDGDKVIDIELVADSSRLSTMAVEVIE